MKWFNAFCRVLGVFVITVLGATQPSRAAPNLPLPWFDLVITMPVDLFNNADDSLRKSVTRCVLDHDEVLTVRTDEFSGDRWIRQLDFEQIKADESLAIELLTMSSEAIKQKQKNYFVFSKAGPDFEMSYFSNQNTTEQNAAVQKQVVLRGLGNTRLQNSVGRQLVKAMVSACGLKSTQRKVRFQRWLSGAQGVPFLP